MPSKARIAFRENVKDVQRLLDLHKDKGGIAQGRRYGLEVLNKSAIVLLTSFWEAYCEDIAAEALEHIVAPSMVTSKAAI
jgi:RiboL-PSP-HEPN